MKKFLLVCFCFMFVAISFFGCGKKKVEVSISDWDGDKIESEWEKPFQSLGDSSRVFDNEYTIIEVGTAEEFRKMGSNEMLPEGYSEESGEIIVYKLTSDIDLGGKALNGPIELTKKMILWGNNKIVDNFKLGDGDNQRYNLIAGAAAIYDFRVSMRYQKLNINVNDNGENNLYISPFINVQILENISVKGGLYLSKFMDANRSYGNYKNISLLCSKTDDNAGVTIKKCDVLGVIKVEDKVEGQGAVLGSAKAEYSDKLTASGLIDKADNANITNSSVDVEMNIYSRSSSTIGGICASAKNAFLENNKVKLKVDKKSYEVNAGAGAASFGLDIFGGLVGKLETSEIKNCEVEKFIASNEDNENSKLSSFAFGGAIGSSKESTLSFIKVNANLVAKNLQDAVAGGAIGSEENTIARKFIVLGEIDVSNCNINYLTNFVGNSYNGFFEGIISSVNLSYTGKLAFENNKKYSEQTQKINVGLIFIQSKYITIREANYNVQNAKVFDYDAYNNKNSLSNIYSLTESKQAKYLPALNHTLSDSNITLTIEYTTENTTNTNVLESGQVNLGGLLYILNGDESTYRPLFFQNNFYRQGSTCKINNENCFEATRTSALISYLTEFSSLNYNYNYLKSSFFNELLDNVKDSTAEDKNFDVANLSFELSNRYIGSVYRGYGIYDNNIIISDLDLSDHTTDGETFLTSLAKDGIRLAGEGNDTFYGHNQFYGIYKISFSEMASYYGDGGVDYPTQKNRFVDKMLSSLYMYKISNSQNQFDEIRIYSESSRQINATELASLNLVPYNQNNYTDDSQNGFSFKGYLDAFILNYLCNLEANNDSSSGSTRKIDYIQIVSYGEDLIFNIVYPENNGVVRKDRVEINRLKIAESAEDYNLYVICTKTNVN